jgi:hypothetical protein
LTTESAEQKARRLTYMPLGEIVGAVRNPKAHDVPTIEDSMERFGYAEAPLLDERTGRLVAGHGRVKTLNAMKKAGKPPPDGVEVRDGEWFLPVQRGWASKDDAEAEAYLMASNQLVTLGGWNDEERAALLGDLLKQGEAALRGTGFDKADVEAMIKPQPEHIGLASKFVVPPFTVLDARQGYWQERKRAWLSMGIESEVGRGENLLKFSETVQLSRKQREGSIRTGESGHAKQFEMGRATGGTSIFDPVLCELIYRWFTPPGGSVLDPFAGGSVRGVVADRLGLHYTGVELRQEQVDANVKQRQKIIDPKPGPGSVGWVCGDSFALLAADFASQSFDLVFSCPPYGNLEVYSDDQRDLSTMTDDSFDLVYAQIIRDAVALLKPNRFACFVVGDYRDEKGFYRGLPQRTIEAFERAGAQLYNEAVLVTAVGTLSMRVASYFPKGRKLGKGHQNVLVFFKGDPTKIQEELGPLEIPPESMQIVVDAESAVDQGES